jgi:tetratricopeptide (TPR) repeat protein
MMRDRLLAGLLRRLEGALTDPTAVLDGQALREAQQLLAATPANLLPDGEGVDIEVLLTVAQLHTARFFAQSARPAAESDRRTALALYDRLERLHPDLREDLQELTRLLQNTNTNLLNRVDTLREDARRTKDTRPLNEAVTLLSDELALARTDDPNRYALQVMLGEALYDRFTLRGDAEDRDAAIDAYTTAVHSDDAHADPRIVAKLGTALRRRYAHAGHRMDLDTAFTELRKALANTDDRRPGRTELLATLAAVALERYELLREDSDLDTAVAAGEEAVARTPAGHHERPDMLSNLAGALRARFLRTSSTLVGDASTDLNASIAAMLAAVDATPDDDQARAAYLSHLGILYLEHFEHEKDTASLDQAVRHAHSSVELTADTAPYRGFRLHNYGRALYARSLITNAAEDLDRAIDMFEAAETATPPRIDRHATLLEGLASALRTRFLRTGRDDDRRRARNLLNTGARTETAASDTRLQCAWQLGTTWLEDGDPTAALATFRYAVDELLPRVVWRGLAWSSRAHQLRRIRGLARDAATAAILCGQLTEAVVLLEYGRVVLWAQQLATRGDRSRLAERHPKLASELDAVCAGLDSSDEWAETGADGATRRELADRFTSLLGTIRALPGFDRFLHPPTFDELRHAADDGPVVIINTNERRCDALLLTPDHQGVRLCPLPDVTVTDLTRHTAKFVTSIELFTRATDDAARREPHATMLATLRWLWDTVTAPVLTTLGLDQPRGDVPLPRIWWCPTGPLALLPLHAAGHHPPPSADKNPTGRWLGDFAISSYVPSLQALLRSRGDSPEAARPRHVLGVGMRHTPYGDYPELTSVSDELAVLSTVFGQQLTTLQDADATREQVREALHSASWAHFACHGGYDLATLSPANLALHDGLLTVHDIAALQLEHADLAFLSACHTARSEIPLADEAVHLVGACQVAGFRHVIGTQWSIDDRTAPLVASHVYDRLTDGSPGDPATALHDAVASIRAQNRYRSPMHWAPYVHIGP